MTPPPPGFRRPLHLYIKEGGEEKRLSESSGGKRKTLKSVVTVVGVEQNMEVKGDEVFSAVDSEQIHDNVISSGEKDSVIEDNGGSALQQRDASDRLPDNKDPHSDMR